MGNTLKEIKCSQCRPPDETSDLWWLPRSRHFLLAVPVASAPYRLPQSRLTYSAAIQLTKHADVLSKHISSGGVSSNHIIGIVTLVAAPHNSNIWQGWKVTGGAEGLQSVLNKLKRKLCDNKNVI